MQHSCAEQRELGPPIPAHFAELESVDMPFERPLAPGQRQAGPHRGLVWSDASGKGLEFRQVARFYLAELRVQLRSLTLLHHLHERLCQVVSGFGTWTGLSDQRQLRLLPLVERLE